ncbi:hypothetical protein [Actinoplanes sp. NPDC026623]|uniref:hypothetical protein n=1 Tax=Actinoplanes sp. NPDC026623 TaxID=3155610 RepID=UPI0033E8DB08
MIDITVQDRTGLPPEWDRWFDEEFTDLIASDEDLLRAEFDDFISSSWPQPPTRTSPPAPRGVNAQEPTPPQGTAVMQPRPTGHATRLATAP